MQVIIMTVCITKAENHQKSCKLVAQNNISSVYTMM